MAEQSISADIERCTCGHEDSDDRMDVLRCVIHGQRAVTWPDPAGFAKRTEQALGIARECPITRTTSTQNADRPEHESVPAGETHKEQGRTP